MSEPTIVCFSGALFAKICEKVYERCKSGKESFEELSTAMMTLKNIEDIAGKSSARYISWQEKILSQFKANIDEIELFLRVEFETTKPTETATYLYFVCMIGKANFSPAFQVFMDKYFY